MKKNLTLSLLSAVLLTFSFAPFQTGFLAYAALVPLFLLLRGLRLKEAFRWGYFTGFWYAAGTLYWIGWVTGVGLIGAMLVWPLFIALFSVLHARLTGGRPRWTFAVVPFLWVAIEYLQSFGDLAFPWNYLGYTQSYYYPLIQHAAWTGVYGTSFWIVTLNVLIFLMMLERGWSRSRRRYLAAALLLFLLPLLHGWHRLSTRAEPEASISVALVQGNVDPFAKWQPGQTEKNFDIYAGLTLQAAAQKPQLIIWPETAIPFYLRAEKKYLQRFHRLADSLKTPILTGAIDYQMGDSSDYVYYNAAFLAVPSSRELQSYWKMRLVPFSERVPFRDIFLFNWIRALLVDMQMPIGDYARGDVFRVLTMPRPDGAAPLRFSVPICFESAFPELNRRFVAAGAELLVIITNDAWFGKTSGPHQHARFAVFRAIENSVPVARCANTGISCFVDRDGRVSGQIPWYRESITQVRVTLSPGGTFYTRHGNLFARCCSLIAVLAVLGTWLKFGRNS